MAELADALDSGSSEGNFMEVQVLLPAPTKKSILSYDKMDFFERCVPLRGTIGRDASFGRDVRFAREGDFGGTHHITFAEGKNITMAQP